MKVTDDEIKRLVKAFIRDMSRKYPDMRDTNKKLLDELENKDDIDLYILNIVDTYKAALRGSDTLFTAVMAAGIKDDMPMRRWIVYFYYMMNKTLIERPAKEDENA